MELVLHYRGPLKANGRPDHKHEIRRVIHRTAGDTVADDNLVTSLSVRTSQLLEACTDRSLVVLVMRIRIGRTMGTVGNGVLS